MSEDHHPVDAALRRLVGDPEPTPHDHHLGEERLRRAIEAEASRSRGGWNRRLLAVATCTTLLLVVGYAVLRPSQVQAAVEEIATATEAVDPVTLTAGEYFYTRTEVSNLGLVPKEDLGGVPFEQDQLVYLLSAVRETWIAADGSIQIKTQHGQPTFFTPDAEQAYYAAGLDERDAGGETVTEAFPPPESTESWPIEIDALDEAILERAADRDLPHTIEYLDVAIDLLRENLTPPQLRANTIRLIGQLPGLEVSEEDDQKATFAVDYEDKGIPTRYVFELDRQGNLVSETTSMTEGNAQLGIPAGTEISAASYLDQQVVDSLESP